MDATFNPYDTNYSRNYPTVTNDDYNEETTLPSTARISKDHSVKKINTISKDFSNIIAMTNKLPHTLRKQGTTATAPMFLPALKPINDEVSYSNLEVQFAAILKFASEDGSSNLARRVEIGFKQVLNIRRPTMLLPGQVPESKAFGEVLAYRCSQFTGSKTVPETHFVYMDSKGDLSIADKIHEDKKLATVQRLVDKGFKELRDHLKDDIENRKFWAHCELGKQGKFSGKCYIEKFKSDPSGPYSTIMYDILPGGPIFDNFYVVDPDDYFTNEGLRAFQKCAVDSYLFGGVDAHMGNILSKKDHKGRYCDFVLIDNGNSFFEFFPEEKDRQLLIKLR